MKMAIVAVLLLPFVTLTALFRRIVRSEYQEAVRLCGTGNLQACEVM